MLGVEVFRDKQGLGQKQRDGKKEEVEDGVEEGAVENEGELDLENGDENVSSEPKTGGDKQGTSSWECGGGLTEEVLKL